MRYVPGALVFTVVLALPGVASARQAPTLKDLATHLSSGEKVIVLDRSGKTAAGRLDKLTDEEVVVRSETNTIVVPSADVRRVSVPRHGKRNGFLIGAGLGVFFGVVASRFEAGGAGSQAAMVLVSTGLYGAIGLGLGALWPSERVLYRAPDTAAAPSMPLANLVAGRRAGIRLAFRW